jgi:hypothetical protein
MLAELTATGYPDETMAAVGGPTRVTPSSVGAASKVLPLPSSRPPVLEPWR